MAQRLTVSRGEVLLSRNAVRQRIERLERQGHIAGCTVVRAGGDTGGVVSALVLVYCQDRMRGSDVLAALKRISEVVICEILSGDFDIMVRLEAASLERVRGIREDIAQMPGVRDTGHRAHPAQRRQPSGRSAEVNGAEASSASAGPRRLPFSARGWRSVRKAVIGPLH